MAQKDQITTPMPASPRAASLFRSAVILKHHKSRGYLQDEVDRALLAYLPTLESESAVGKVDS